MDNVGGLEDLFSISKKPGAQTVMKNQEGGGVKGGGTLKKREHEGGGACWVTGRMLHSGRQRGKKPRCGCACVARVCVASAESVGGKRSH